MIRYFALVLCIYSSLWTIVTVNGNQTASWWSVQANSSEFIHTLPFPNSVFKYKFRGNQTNGSFVLFEADYLTDGPGLHIHTREDELFHIIDGNVQFIVNGTQFCGSPGDYVYVPRNVPQGIRIQNGNNRTKPVRIQIQLFPAGLEDFLDEIAPLYYNGQSNLTRQDELATKYGLKNLGTVQWKDLDCFPSQSSNSNRLTSTLLTLVSFVTILF